MTDESATFQDVMNADELVRLREIRRCKKRAREPRLFRRGQALDRIAKRLLVHPVVEVQEMGVRLDATIECIERAKAVLRQLEKSARATLDQLHVCKQQVDWVNGHRDTAMPFAVIAEGLGYDEDMAQEKMLRALVGNASERAQNILGMRPHEPCVFCGGRPQRRSSVRQP